MRFLRSLESDTAPKKEYYLAKYMEFVRPFLKLREPNLFIIPEIKTEQRVARKSTLNTTTSISHNRETPKKRRRQDIATEETVILDDEEDEEAHLEGQDREIDVQEEVEIVDVSTDNYYNDGGAGDTGGGSLTYTLRNGQLVDTKLDMTHTSQGGSVAATTPVAMACRSEEDNNPDLLFLKSLLVDMATLTNKKKNKFKSIVTTTLSDLMDD